VNKSPTPSRDSRIVAAFHAVGQAWHAVVARIEAQRPTLIEARVFPAGTSASSMSHWLAGHQVGRVACVLPGSAIICRTCTLPNGSPAQLDAALKLQAETQLLGSVPPHRMASAVLHQAEGETSRSGVILAWPTSASAPKPPATETSTVFAPVIASLAALLNGARPEEPLLLIDQKDGTLAMAMSHSNGAVFRAARFDSSSSDRGAQSIMRTLTETALSVGHSGQFINEMLSRVQMQLDAAIAEVTLLLPDSLRSSLAARLHGAPDSAEWWSRFGIVAGVVLAAADHLAPLTQLQDQPPATKPSRLLHLSERLSSQRTALRLLAASIAIFVLAPVVFAGLRLLILEIRYPGLEERLKDIDRTKQELAIYSDLRNHAWSMTKVLSDLVVSAPEGIELDTIAVDFGKELRIKGTARSHGDISANDVIINMQLNMQEYGVFKEVRPSWDNSNAQGTSYEFSLVARIADPHRSPAYPEVMDFAGMTLADRKYGKQPRPGESSAALASRPSETAPAATSSSGSNDREANDPPEIPAVGAPSEDPTDSMTGEPTEVAMEDQGGRGSRRPLGDRTGAADGTSTRGEAADPSLSRVPQELSEAQIAAMTVVEARDAQAEVASALRRAPGLDADTKARLQREFRQLQERIRQGDAS